MSSLKIATVQQPDRLISYWLKEKRVVSCILFFGLLFNGGTVLGPILQGRLIDTLVSAAPLQSVVRQIFLFAGAVVLIQTARFFKRFYVRRFANSTSASMRLMVYNRIIQQPIQALDQENVGNLMTRVVADVELCVEGKRSHGIGSGAELQPSLRRHGFR